MNTELPISQISAVLTRDLGQGALILDLTVFGGRLWDEEGAGFWHAIVVLVRTWGFRGIPKIWAMAGNAPERAPGLPVAGFQTWHCCLSQSFGAWGLIRFYKGFDKRVSRF